MDLEDWSVRLKVFADATRVRLLALLELEELTVAELASVTGLAQALQAVLDGREVADVSIGDRIIPVKLVSSATPIDDPTDLGNVFLRTGDGRMVPMSAIATLVEGSTAPGLSRDGQQRAVPISIEPTPGVALRQAMAVADEIASSVLPAGYGIKQTGEAAALAADNGARLLFGHVIDSVPNEANGADFDALCEQEGILIRERLAFDEDKVIVDEPNFLASVALYRLGRAGG